MTLNTDMFRRIHRQISIEPLSHDQRLFESHCGTTRCVAGWAIWFDADDRGLLHTGSTVNDLAKRYVADHGIKVRNLDCSEHIERAAADILGLRHEEAELLFYTMSNHDAVEYVAELAQGIIPDDLKED